MDNILIGKFNNWLEKAKVAYHKHDGWIEHPVAVDNHQKWFEEKAQAIAEKKYAPEIIPLEQKVLPLLNAKKLVESIDFDWGMKKIDAIKTLREYSVKQKKPFEVANQFSNWGVPTDIVSHLLASIDEWREKQKTGEKETAQLNEVLVPEKEGIKSKYFATTKEALNAYKENKITYTELTSVLLYLGHTDYDVIKILENNEIDSKHFKEAKKIEALQSKNWDDVLENIGSQLGSTEGGAYQDKNTGQHFYIKFPGEERAEIENLATKLYALAGVPVVQTEVIDFKGKKAIKSDWLAGHPMTLEEMHHSPSVVKNFAIDAWLGNWDVIGLKEDNIITYGGSGFRIDTGGALTFRARGEKKEFGPIVKELKTFLNPTINPQTVKVFGGVPRKVLAIGVNTLFQITDEQINDVVNSSNLIEPQKRYFKAILKARRDYIINEFSKEREKRPCKPGMHRHDKFEGHPITQQHRGEPKLLDIDKLLSTHKNENIRNTYLAAKEFFGKTGKSPHSSYYKEMIFKFAQENSISIGTMTNLSSAFHLWQQAEYSGFIEIRAAINELKGIADKEYARENGFWIYEREVSPGTFEESYKIGRDSAIALIPFIAASRQVLLRKYPDGIIPAVYRGVSGEMGKKIAKILEGADPTFKIAIPHDGISGYSLKRSMARGWGKYGVVFSKKNISIDNIWGYFNAWSSEFAREEEILVDSNVVSLFSKDEIEKE